MIRRPPISTLTDTLFPYTTLFRSHELLGEIDRDHRLAARAMLRGIGTKARQVDDRIFAVERREFGRGRAAEQGTDELAVPREFGDDLDADAMLGLRAAEELLAIEPVATREMREEIFLQRGEIDRKSTRLKSSH